MERQTFNHPLDDFHIRGDLTISQKKVELFNGLSIEGHLIAPGSFLVIEGNLNVSGSIICADIYVSGNLNSSSLVCLEGSVVVDKTVNCKSISSFGDIIVEEYIECISCYAAGVIDCLDIDSNGHPIEAEELVCRTLDK